MRLSVNLETNALGVVSNDHYDVPSSDIEKGVYVDSLFPDSYDDYVKSIHVKYTDNGEAVQITSSYGSCRYPSDEEGVWSSGTIGLSYAWCKGYIRLIPE